MCSLFFFFNDTATTEIYTFSLHDALPIWCGHQHPRLMPTPGRSWTHCSHAWRCCRSRLPDRGGCRSEEHTSELQSRQYIVCRLLLEKKKPAIIHAYR